MVYEVMKHISSLQLWIVASYTMSKATEILRDSELAGA